AEERGALDAELRAHVELRDGGHELRELIEDALYADAARLLESAAIDGHDRTVGFEVAPHDSGARDGHLFQYRLLSESGAPCPAHDCRHRCRKRRQRRPTRERTRVSHLEPPFLSVVEMITI